MRFIKLAIICSALVGSAQSHAATVVDVDNLVPLGSSGYSGFWSGQPIASFPRTTLYQTFAIGASGTFASLELTSSAGGKGNVYVELFRGGSLASVGTTSLATIGRPASMFGEDMTISLFDFSSFAISVAAGEVLTFKLSADTCMSAAGCTTFIDHNNALAKTANGYAGGSFFLDSGAGPVVSLVDDLSFRTSIIVADPVPEPASWAMLAIGFGFAGGWMRNRAARTRLA